MFLCIAEIFMPVPQPTLRSITLPNGLRVVLCSAPRLKRCAAALRVAAGSHDVPDQWPGLAHFLEHLFFLGTERFPADQALMAYVQRHGGQVNASTRERTTDFFFELAPAAFAGGLERLCEMLAYPRMTLADQLREREVLHAEFIAWSRDAASREQLERLQPLSALHPLRGFHAGNRFSLPVPRPAFQRALQDFYRSFYQAGQMTLSLSGPLTLDELQALATHCGESFADGCRVEQLKPPALMDKRPTLPHAAIGPGRTHLIFHCESLPRAHERAAGFLCTWMNNAQPGGLVAQLRDAGLIESLTAQVFYAFAGQTLIDIELDIRTEKTSQAITLLFGWLTFFKSRYRELLGEYARLQTRKLEVAGALALARHYSADDQPPGLRGSDVQALQALLEQLTPAALLQPIALEQTAPIEWRLPEPNPFLQAPDAPAGSTPVASALVFSDQLPCMGEAAFFLRWTLGAPQPTLHQMLNDSLKALMADAEQAGVTLAFTAYGDYWQLKLSGLLEPIPAVLKRVLKLLTNPDAQTLARYGRPGNTPAPIPIRQLLKSLPDHFLSRTVTQETDNVNDVWAHARWLGFATGLGPAERPAMGDALRDVPGIPDANRPTMTLQPTNQRWVTEPSESSEDAVLMFYPIPTTRIEDEALWRLLAQRVQAPFYQRLRVELQLGYAVFSGFRQIAGQGGMLFGVQSPNVRAAELVAHIHDFLRVLPTQVEHPDMPPLIAALRDQLTLATMEAPQAAEMLWQAHLAGHPGNYPDLLQHSLAQLPTNTLKAAASRVALPEASVFYLSNRAKPSRSRAGTV